MSGIQTFSDLRTGRITGINDERSSNVVRLICDELNSSRSALILQTVRGRHAELGQHSESVYVRLDTLGLNIDSDGIIKSELLEWLPGGQESTPYRDNELGIIYKLFPISEKEQCGRKIDLKFDEHGEGTIEITITPGSLEGCLNKLLILNKAGAHPTEIVGLTECHRFFLAKQPLAKRITLNDSQRKKAMNFAGAITDGVSKFNRLAVVTWAAGHAWLISDLTPENIMVDSNKDPTIIDALVYRLTPSDRRYPLWLNEKILDAQDLREGRKPPYRSSIDEGVDDNLL